MVINRNASMDVLTAPADVDLRTKVRELSEINESMRRELETRERSERRVRADAERYALAIQAANEGLWDWNLQTGEIFFSTQWKTMLGFEAHELDATEDAWFQLVHPRDVESLKGELRRHLEENKADIHREYRIFTKTGDIKWMLCRGRAVRDSAGKATRIIGTQNDITARKTTEMKLIHDVFHDALTGLPNRPLFMERLRYALVRAERKGAQNIAVLFLDLDRFKVINDSLGHAIGDQLLIEFANRLQTCVRPSDTLARFGGDEFCLLLEDVNGLDGAAAIATRIQQELKQAIVINRNEFFVTASIGIALGSRERCSAEDLLRDADIAMYRAKATGRARQEFYQSGMHTQAINLQSLESGLHRAVIQLGPKPAENARLNRALQAKEFLLHYQPIVSVQTGKVTGFEALIRWNHRARGRVCPDDFIPLAEETGLIVPITFWVVREACTQLRNWRARFPELAGVTMNVNVSPRAFAQVSLVSEIASILKETGLPGSALKIEVTETALMKNSEATAFVLSQLRKLGVQLCLDDFGTGYSSLSYLHRFHMDVLKIDRSFITALRPGDRKSSDIVKAILALAQSLGMSVVAEGVETQEQMTQLRDMNCGHVQGYLFSKPIEPAEVENLAGTVWTAAPVTLDSAVR
ncbi:MAG TPA: EAL domain-containing protein [Planctomycetota bacterium]|jgi:diguanylate cyclase (GGDEF)-like protein/PAS domain S-box-containing protein